MLTSLFSGAPSICSPLPPVALQVAPPGTAGCTLEPTASTSQEAHERENSEAKSSFRENPVSGFLIWIISGLYLLTMVWFILLSPIGGYGPQEAQPWLVPAVVVFTVSYGILMLLLWPHEKVSPQGRPERLVR
jgi:hypothetical protein